MLDTEIEVFRADTRASRGITADRLASVASFDCAAHPIPLVIGHPKSDSPAQGTIAGFRLDGSKLFAKLKGVKQAVVDGIRDGSLLNRSMAFFDEDHEANPTPGKLAPRHLGFLGGSAPGIPGMSPLSKALAFAADDEAGDNLVIEGAPAPAVVYAPPATGVTHVFDVAPFVVNPAVVGDVTDDSDDQAPRVKAKRSVEAAIAMHQQAMDGTVPKTGQAADAHKVVVMSHLKAARSALNSPNFSAEGSTVEKTPEQLAEEARIKAASDKLDADRLAFDARVKSQFEASNSSIVDGLVTTGKVLPAEADDLKGVFNALGQDELTFGAGDKATKATAASKLAGFLSAAIGKRVPIGERVSPSKTFTADTVDRDAPVAQQAGSLTAKAKALQAERPGMTFEAAIEEVSGGGSVD